MGLYDREYVREEDEYPSRNPLAGQSMTVVLIVINVAVYLADALMGQSHWLMSTLSVSGETVTQPWMWWQFLTAGFAHDPRTIQHIAGNMIGLWFFGTIIEQVRGRNEFLRFYLTAIVLGNVCFALRQFFFVGPLMIDGQALWTQALGASGGVTAVIVLFICLFPKQTILLFFVIPMPAWLLGVFIIGSDVLGSFRPFSNGARVAHDVHLSGALFAFLYWRYNWNLANWVPAQWLGEMKSKWSQPRLKVHKPPEASYEAQDAEADRLLEKVHREGEEKLTARERRILEEYARRMRQKLR